MAISIRAGSKKNIEQRKIKIALGWKEQGFRQNFDLDLSAFLLNIDGTVRSDGDFIFYNQLQSACGVVQHAGDETEGNDDGDAEIITVDLPKLDTDIAALNICVTIHNAELFNYSFGMVKGAYLVIIDEDSGEEKIHCNLSDDMAAGSTLVLARLSRRKDDWRFEVVNEKRDGNLKELAKNFGVTF